MSSSAPDQGRAILVAGILVAGIVAVAAVVGVTGWALAPRATSGPDGPSLSIDVIAPVDPAPVPGGVLEVGILNDEFDRAALDRQPLSIEADYRPPDAYVGEDGSPVEPVGTPMPRAESPIAEATVTRTDPLADGSRLFGFDRSAASSVVAVTSPSNDSSTPTPVKTSQEFFE